MAKLTFTHWITERRDFGKKTVTQRMDILVDYDPHSEDVEVDAVYIFEGCGGVRLCRRSRCQYYLG